jgi:hypothetical protein
VCICVCVCARLCVHVCVCARVLSTRGNQISLRITNKNFRVCGNFEENCGISISHVTKIFSFFTSWGLSLYIQHIYPAVGETVGLRVKIVQALSRFPIKSMLVY